MPLALMTGQSPIMLGRGVPLQQNPCLDSYSIKDG